MGKISLPELDRTIMISAGKIYNALTFGGDCNTVLGTKNEQPFRDAVTEKIQKAFRVRRNQVFNLKVECGSIIVTFYINQLQPSFIEYNITNIGTIVTTNFTIALPDGTTFRAIQANVGYDPLNVTIFTLPKPTVPPTTVRRYELVFDYTPIMAAVALGIACMVLCVCCTWIIHSCYLRKEKYTEYNSMTIQEYEAKMKAKEEKEMENNDIPMTGAILKNLQHFCFQSRARIAVAKTNKVLVDAHLLFSFQTGSPPKRGEA